MKYCVIAVVLIRGMACYAEPICDFPKEYCVSQAAFDDAESNLAGTLTLIQAKIDDNGFEDFLVEREEIKHSLIQGQAAWQNYRDQHCAAVFRLMSGGSSRHVDELSCLTDLTNARVRQLQELYEVQ